MGFEPLRHIGIYSMYAMHCICAFQYIFICATMFCTEISSFSETSLSKNILAYLLTWIHTKTTGIYSLT